MKNLTCFMGVFNISFLEFYIDRKKLLSNIEIIKEKINGSKICAVVKANAYGHGINHICTSLQNCVDYFAVANVFEGVEVRKLVNNPILVLGEIENEEIQIAVKNELEISVGSLDKMKTVCAINERVKIHIKVDTGMNRCGVKEFEEFLNMIDYAKKSVNVEVCGVYSHLNCVSDEGYTLNQIVKFDRFKVECKKVFPNSMSHLSNSGGVFGEFDCKCDMVRIGIALYGYLGEEVQNVGELFSRIMLVKAVHCGEVVGYDNTFKAEHDMTIAIVRGGYADGINLLLSNRACVIIKDKRCRIVGKVCMDMFFVDVSGCDVTVGERVEIFGDKQKLSQLIFKTGLIPYEILTTIGERVERTLK